VAPVVGLVGTGASWWNTRIGRRHRMRTRGGRRREALRWQQNSMTLEASLALLQPVGKGGSEWQRPERMTAGRRLTGVDEATTASDNAVGTTGL
jgi:hypothetical protein